MNQLHFLRMSTVAIAACLSAFSSSALAQESPTLVTYKSVDEPPIKAISAIALQSGAPIGIVFGREQQQLCRSERSFDIRNKTPAEALSAIGASVGYRLKEEQGVLILTAPDLESWQSTVLEYRYSSFPGASNTVMKLLATSLTVAIRMEIGKATTVAGSTLYNPDSHRISLNDASNISTEEIANRIVKLDKKGLWILHGTIEHPSGPTDAKMSIYSYADEAEQIQSLDCNP